MTQILKFIAIGTLLFASAGYLVADVARPKPSAAPEREGKVVLHTGLTIVPDAKKYEARLQIPERDLKILREALASIDSNPTMMQRLTHSSTRTIIAGAFLFLSISFAGVWLARSGQSRTAKTAVAVLLIAVVLGAATVITRANAGPPGWYEWKNLPQALNEGRSTNGGLDIEIVPDGDGIKLIVPLRNTKKPNGEEE